MATITKADRERKKQLAFTLFVDNGFEQKVIAEITGISEKSISKWKNDGKWEEERNELKAGSEHVKKRILRMYNNWITQIEEREPPHNVPDSKESDALNKLADASKKLQTELSTAHKAETGKLFVTYIQKVHGQAKAIDVVNLWHEFLMSTT